MEEKVLTRRILVNTLVRSEDLRRSPNDHLLLPPLNGLTEREALDALGRITVSEFFELQNVPSAAEFYFADLVESLGYTKIVIAKDDSSQQGNIGCGSGVLSFRFSITANEVEAILAKWRPVAELQAWKNRREAAEEAAGLDDKSMRAAISAAKRRAEEKVREDFAGRKEAFEKSFRARDPHPPRPQD